MLFRVAQRATFSWIPHLVHVPSNLSTVLAPSLPGSSELYIQFHPNKYIAQSRTSGHHPPPLPQRSPLIRRRHRLHNYASLALTNPCLAQSRICLVYFDTFDAFYLSFQDFVKVCWSYRGIHSLEYKCAQLAEPPFACMTGVNFIITFAPCPKLRCCNIE